MCSTAPHTHIVDEWQFSFCATRQIDELDVAGFAQREMAFFLFSFGLPSLSIHWVCVKIRFKFAGFDSDEHSDLTVQLVPNFMIFNLDFNEINFSLFRFLKSIDFDLINYKM